MYSKLVIGLAAVGYSAAAEIVRRDTGAGGGHDHGHAHAAPSSGYSEPASAGYSAPSTGYNQPSSGYAASSGYGGYDVGYEEDGFDLSTIIIPLLIIFGLSLLFPTITSVAVNNGGRRKRDLESGKTHCTNTLYRYISHHDINNQLLTKKKYMNKFCT